MAEITLTSEISCSLELAAGSDLDVVRHWKPQATPEQVARLVTTFLRERHHSPLEQGGWCKFRVHAPLFVLRQIERHRWLSQAADDDLGLSFSEDSGRYRELKPVFWVPREDRPMVPGPDFHPMRPEFVLAEESTREALIRWLGHSYQIAWNTYQSALGRRIAPEVARAALGTAVYTNLSMAGNLRAWLAFLALRTKDPAAAVTSHVQAECEEVGRAVEAVIRERWPLTYAAWHENGRVAP